MTGDDGTTIGNYAPVRCIVDAFRVFASAKRRRGSRDQPENAVFTSLMMPVT